MLVYNKFVYNGDNMFGKLIVIEGTDGSGKGTQLELLKKRLDAEGVSNVNFSFPQYGKKSAGPVEEYLNGKYGEPNELNPYAASIFYAMDRFDLSREIRDALKEKLVILDRYVDSNAGHQGGKISNPEEREKFVEWLYDLEFRILGVPRPDLVVILHVPAEIGQQLVAKKVARSYLEKGTHDKHEGNLEHLKNAEASYLWLAEQHPQDHKIIECVEDGKILAPEVIHQKVYNLIAPLLK